MRIVNKLLVLTLAAIPFVILLHIFVHITILEKVTKNPSGFSYANTKWSYSIDLSNEWKRINKIFSQVIWLTNIIQFTNSKENLELQISYNEVYGVDNFNLIEFVQEEVKYAEHNHSITTEGVEEITQTTDRWIIGLSGQDSESYFLQYYISGKSDPGNAVIYKLYFTSKKPFTNSQKEEATKVLDNFNMIPGKIAI
jgi:hypothetical protein